MRTFFEILLILAVIALGGVCFWQYQKLQNSQPTEPAGGVQIGDEEVAQVRKLATRFGIDSEKADTESVAELLADIEVLAYNAPLVPDALTDEEFTTVKGFIGVTEETTVKKLEKQGEFLKKAANKKAVLIP